jgi:uncharacterized protein (TIGR02145 family)
MTENLNLEKFQNGDLITEAKTTLEWRKAAKKGMPAWCYYNNDQANGEKYGKLYNWFAVNDPRGLAPDGWHIPKDTEWKILIEYLGGFSTAGLKLKSSSDWHTSNDKSGDGINDVGFSGFPSGVRDDNGFAISGIIGAWWSSSEYSSTRKSKLKNKDAILFEIVYFGDFIGLAMNDKGRGLSVRCVKN